MRSNKELYIKDSKKSNNGNFLCLGFNFYGNKDTQNMKFDSLKGLWTKYAKADMQWRYKI